MNEEIKSLITRARNRSQYLLAHVASQRGCRSDELSEDEKTEMFNNTFAQLLIQECIDVCESRVGNKDYNTGRMHCASDLKEHFGVE